MYTRLLIVSITLLVAFIACDAQSKKKKSKTPEEVVLSTGFKNVSPCDPIYVPWFTDISVVKKHLIADGITDIVIDTSTASMSMWIRCTDTYFKYSFVFDSTGAYHGVFIDASYHTSLAAERTFRDACLSASVNFTNEDDENSDRPRKKEYDHKCARTRSFLTIQMTDDTTIQYFFLHARM